MRDLERRKNGELSNGGMRELVLSCLRIYNYG